MLRLEITKVKEFGPNSPVYVSRSWVQLIWTGEIKHSVSEELPHNTPCSTLIYLLLLNAHLEFPLSAFASSSRRHKMKTNFSICKHSSHILANKDGFAVFASQIKKGIDSHDAWCMSTNLAFRLRCARLTPTLSVRLMLLKYCWHCSRL